MATSPKRAVLRQDQSTDAVLAWIDQTLGSGRRVVGPQELAALMTPLGWEVSFPLGHGTAATVNVVKTERFVLVRYTGAPFVSRYRRQPSEVSEGPRIAVVELVHAGAGWLHQGDVARPLLPGDAVLHPPVGSHVIEWTSEHCDRTYVVMLSRLFGDRVDVLRPDALVQHGAPLVAPAVQLAELVDGSDHVESVAAAQALHMLLSATVTGAIEHAPPSEGSDLRERVREVLLARHGEPGLDADAVAFELRVSRRHLFAQFAGSDVTFASMLREIRLDHAFEMMSRGDPDLTVTRVAREAGFAGAAQLSRAFRARFGTTPSQLRSATIRAARRTGPSRRADPG